MKIITKTRASYFIALLLGTIVSASAIAMAPLSDDEMSNVTGQALLMMDMREGEGISKDLNFYRAGLDAIVELNANFEKLQLGCGGVNGPGCDIDIDHLSLSGPDNCPVGRPGCDAILTRPFFEFAIDNDGTPHREIVGFRLSAEMAEGLLTAGQNDGTPNGINSLSGYMDIAATTGYAKTKESKFTEPVGGKICVTLFGGCVADGSFTTDGAPITVPEQDVEFNVGAFQVSGNRLKQLLIEADTVIDPGIVLNDQSSEAVRKASAKVWGININLDITMETVIENLGVDISIEQDLGMIHKIPVNNPFSLSMQSTNVLWPEAPVEAETGWWMAFSDPIDLGVLDTPSEYRVNIDDAFPQVAQFVTDYLSKDENKVKVASSSAIGGILGLTLHVKPGNINLSGQSALLDIENIPLGASQTSNANCWGSAAFC